MYTQGAKLQVLAGVQCVVQREAARADHHNCGENNNNTCLSGAARTRAERERLEYEYCTYKYLHVHV